MPHCFAGLVDGKPGKKSKKTYLYKANRKTKVRQVLWGDWLTVVGEEADGWLRIRWAPNSSNPETLYIPKSHTSTKRPLEIIFLDVGQGDGAVLITPERNKGEAVIVIDAGISGNMHAFLSKRFRSYKKAFRFHAAVITHPDIDHYGGFETIFGAPVFGFDVIYHNGLAELPVKGTFEKIGGVHKDASTGRSYVKNLATVRADIEKRFGTGAPAGKFAYAQLMRNALGNPNIKDIAMLAHGRGAQEDGRTWVPGFAPSKKRGYSIEVMGPVPEPDTTGKLRLRRIGSYGETKNGHSILLRLHFGKFKVLFGGDLNEKAEKFLLCHYSGEKRFPRTGTAAHGRMVGAAANWFRSDIMKVCHHGSEKVTDAFIETVNPAAFVISSGDEEGHVHPRPDLLGRLGRLGRGDSPVILSTELQRSTRETEDQKLVTRLSDKVLALEKAPSDKWRQKVIDDIMTLGRSNVTVFGSIYLKTDGERLLTAFRIETGSEKKKWFTFEYQFDANGDLQLAS